MIELEELNASKLQQKIDDAEVGDVINLYGYRLDGDTFEGIDFNAKKVTLANAYFGNADLTGANLSDVHFYNATFYATVLNDVNFNGATFENTEFDHIENNVANFTEAHFTETKFEKTDFSGANFTNATFDQKSRQNARSAKANLTTPIKTPTVTQQTIIPQTFVDLSGDTQTGTLVDLPDNMQTGTFADLPNDTQTEKSENEISDNGSIEIDDVDTNSNSSQSTLTNYFSVNSSEPEDKKNNPGRVVVTAENKPSDNNQSTPSAIDLRFNQGDEKPAYLKNYKLDFTNPKYTVIKIGEDPKTDVHLYENKATCEKPNDDSIEVMAQRLCEKAKESNSFTIRITEGEKADKIKLAKACAKLGLQPEVMHEGGKLKYDDSEKISEKKTSTSKPPSQSQTIFSKTTKAKEFSESNDVKKAKTHDDAIITPGANSLKSQ